MPLLRRRQLLLLPLPWQGGLPSQPLLHGRLHRLVLMDARQATTQWRRRNLLRALKVPRSSGVESAIKGTPANCRGRHHTLLCPSNTLPSQSNTPRPSAKKFKRPSASNCPSASLTPVNPTQNLAIQPIVTLGPTIIAQLVLNSRRVPVRALLDPCAGNSRICISLVQSLRLQTIPLGPDRFVQCTLASSYNDSQKLLVSARVTELRHIVSPSESASEEIANHYEGMMLADPQFFKAARIVLVLGAEVYPKVMKAQTYSSQGFPWSQLTIFGWIVSGPCPM